MDPPPFVCGARARSGAPARARRAVGGAHHACALGCPPGLVRWIRPALGQRRRGAPGAHAVLVSVSLAGVLLLQAVCRDAHRDRGQAVLQLWYAAVALDACLGCSAVVTADQWWCGSEVRRAARAADERIVNVPFIADSITKGELKAWNIGTAGAPAAPAGGASCSH